MKSYVVDGIEFSTHQEYEEAVKDLKNIANVRANIEMADIKDVLDVYNRAIEDHIFHTLVGMNFLKELQDILLIDGKIPPQRINPIPSQKHQAVVNEAEALHKETEQDESYHIKNEQWLFRSLLVNALLMIAIILMFFIAYNSNNLNIVNYERILNNKYEALEESLEAKYNGMDREETTTGHLQQ